MTSTKIKYKIIKSLRNGWLSHSYDFYATWWVQNCKISLPVRNELIKNPTHGTALRGTWCYQTEVSTPSWAIRRDPFWGFMESPPSQTWLRWSETLAGWVPRDMLYECHCQTAGLSLALLENRKTAPSSSLCECQPAVCPQRFIADGAGAADFMLGRTRALAADVVHWPPWKCTRSIFPIAPPPDRASRT